MGRRAVIGALLIRGDVHSGKGQEVQLAVFRSGSLNRSLRPLAQRSPLQRILPLLAPVAIIAAAAAGDGMAAAAGGGADVVGTLVV